MLTTSSRSLFRPSSTSAVSSRYLRNISSPGLLAASTTPSTSTATSTITTRTTLAPQTRSTTLTLNRRLFSTSSSFQFIQSPVKMAVKDLVKADQFKTSVTEDKSDSLILIDCFATWCGPCRTISPVVEKFSEEYPKVTFYKIDVDDVPDVAQELGVRAMPTFFFFKNGNKVDEVVGANPQAIKNALDKHA